MVRIPILAVTSIWMLALMTVMPAGATAVVFEAQVDAEPARYTFVDGDPEKFQERKWVQEGFVGGAERFSLKAADLPKGIDFSAEGKALIDENDLEGSVWVRKEDLGFLRFQYREVSKFYDGTGGTYHPFNQFSKTELEKDLELEIGQFSIEAGLRKEGLPEVDLLYERRFKDGAKSRLSWGAAREGNVIRNIVPSWQDIDEMVNSFQIKVRKEISGFELEGEQRFEFVETELTREERNLSTRATASDKKIRVHTQNLEADVLTTTFSVSRWFQEEQSFFGTAYRYLHLGNDEVEDIFELNESRVPQSFNNAKQIRNARADNTYNSHTWVGNLMMAPWSWFQVTAKLKSEFIDGDGNSSYPSDTTPASPDGIIDRTEESDTNNKVARFGEGLSLRLTAIPRTSVYSEIEFEQVRDWLMEDRESIAGQSQASANEVFSRKTVTQFWRSAWTTGARVSPWAFLDVTAHFRFREDQSDFDDERETDPGSSTARSAFFDSLNMTTKEVSSRATLKPRRWIRPSFRYRLQTKDYGARTENQDLVSNDMNLYLYSFDIFMQPLKNLWVTTSFSRERAWTVTLASEASTANTPRWNADVNTWLLGFDYTINETSSLTGQSQYSIANNFNDFTDIGLPLGADYDQLDFSLGYRWTPRNDVTVAPQIGLYRYKPNSSADSGAYHAYVISLKASLAWG